MFKEKPTMALATKKADKKPRGRKPLGAVLVDGRWQLTEESLQLAAERVLRYREHNASATMKCETSFAKSAQSCSRAGSATNTADGQSAPSAFKRARL